MKLALLVYIVLCPLNIFLPIGAKNINSTEAVAMMFIVVWLAGLLRKDRLPVPDTVFTVPLFVYFLSSLVLFINTGLGSDVILTVIRHFQFFGVFLIFVTYFKDRKDIYAISNALIASLAILCLIAVIEFVFVYGVSGVDWQRSVLWKKGLIDAGFYPGTEIALERLVSWSAKAGLIATFPIHHAFAVYLCPLIFLLVWRIFLYQKQNMKMIGMLSLLVISLAILFFTNSRTAIGAFLVSIPVLLMFLRSWRLRMKITVLIALLVVIILVVVPDIIVEQSIGWVEILYKSGLSGLGGGVSDRLEYFLGSIDAFLRSPLIGVGYKISIFGIEPHAAIMQALVLKGILGGLALLWILYRMIRVSQRHLRKLKHRKADPIHFLSAAWLFSLTIFMCIVSLGVGLFGYVLPAIPAIAAMSMIVITRRLFAVEKSRKSLESFDNKQNIQ